MSRPLKKRLRRTMMFLNAQRAGLVKDAYVYKPDSIIFDLEDAVAENQKDSARISLYNTLKYADYKGIERVVRINGIDSPYWKEDVRAAVAGKCDCIRIPKCEHVQDVLTVENAVAAAEAEFGLETGSTLLMTAIETPLGVFNSLELVKSSPRIMGLSFGAGDYVRTMRTTRSPEGIELLGARAHLVMAARAAGVMCFDTVYYADVDNLEGLEKETRLIKQMGFDGKSVINPKQIEIIHKVFEPTSGEIDKAERIIRALEANAESGVGVFTVGQEMVDIAMLEGAKRVIELAKASGIYKGEL